MGYWMQQLYLAAGEAEKKAIAAQGESYLRKAIELDPRYAEAWANLGNGKVLSGDVSGAAAAFQKALALKPELIPAQLGYGYCLAEQGDPANAIVHLEGAVKLNPSLSSVSRLSHGHVSQCRAPEGRACHDKHAGAVPERTQP